MIEHMSMILYGQAKIGKTTFAASAPKARIIATEAGHKYLSEDVKSRLKKLRVGAHGWAEFRSLLFTDKGKQIIIRDTGAIIVDTADNLYEMCMDFVCEKNKWAHPEEGAHGSGWRAVSKEFTKCIHALCNHCDVTEIPLIFISHAKMEVIEVGSLKYTRVLPTLTGQAYKIISSAVDTVCMMAYDTLETKNALKEVVRSVKASSEIRTLIFGGSMHVESGTRNPDVVDKVVLDVPSKDGFKYVCDKLREEKDGSKIRPKNNKK